MSSLSTQGRIGPAAAQIVAGVILAGLVALVTLAVGLHAVVQPSCTERSVRLVAVGIPLAAVACSIPALWFSPRLRLLFATFALSCSGLTLFFLFARIICSGN